MEKFEKKLISTLKRKNYSFRGAWFFNNGVKIQDGINLLWTLKSEKVIDFDMYGKGIDYASVKLI